jgi:hypothetical protein
MLTGIMFSVFGLICFGMGWAKAHKTVATECKKLGKFYVGNEIFHCVKIEQKETVTNETQVSLNKS